MSNHHVLNRTILMISLVLVMIMSASAPGTPVASPAPPSDTEPAASTEAVQPAEEVQPTEPPPPAEASEPGKLKDVPRERTLIDLQNGPENKWADYDNWNPYSIGAQAGFGANIIYEPLAYYSAFADQEILWLAESYEYSPDFMELTIKIRPNITWSDGEPFTAEDVAYTLETLKELGPQVQWGSDVQQFVASAEATDPQTVKIKFNSPAPRFFWFMTYKFDTGVFIVPKHIFEGQDWTSFKAFDLEKGWPLTTGPYEVVLSSPEQKVWDRRDQWWAVDAGVAEAMPAPERIVLLPFGDSDQAAQAIMSDQADHGRVSVQNAQVVLDGNPKTTTHSGNELPYGYIDWWPMSLFVNTTMPPFDDPDVRWALSYFIDRQQLIDVALNGVGEASTLPMPPYPGLTPYMDSISDLMETYPTNEFNPEKGAALLTNKGWTKDADGIWTDSSGNKLSITILSYSFLQSIPPVVAEQLKQQGVDATFAMPPDNFDQLFKGTYQAAIWGHGGSIKDPYETSRLYQSTSEAVPGVNAGNYSQWSDPEYDKIVDEMYATPMDDQAKLMELYRKAMEIWLPNLPDIQLVQNIHNILMNTTYWTGWPSDENSYVNEHSYALTWPLVIYNLLPAK